MESAGGKDGSLYQGMMLASFDPVVLWNLLTVPAGHRGFLRRLDGGALSSNVLHHRQPPSTLGGCGAFEGCAVGDLSLVRHHSLPFAIHSCGAAWAVIIIIVLHIILSAMGLCG
jgi:hypothetical protein